MKSKCNQNGFTLAEVLVAVMLLGFMTLVVAAGSGVAIRVQDESTEFSESRLLAATLLTAMENELRYASDLSAEADGTLRTFQSTVYGENTSIQLQAETGETLEEDGGFVCIKQSDGKEVLLLGKKTYPDKLRVKALQITVEDDTVTAGRYRTAVHITLTLNDDYTLETSLLNVNVKSGT